MSKGSVIMRVSLIITKTCYPLIYDRSSPDSRRSLIRTQQGSRKVGQFSPWVVIPVLPELKNSRDGEIRTPDLLPPGR